MQWADDMDHVNRVAPRMRSTTCRRILAPLELDMPLHEAFRAFRHLLGSIQASISIDMVLPIFTIETHDRCLVQHLNASCQFDGINYQNHTRGSLFRHDVMIIFSCCSRFAWWWRKLASNANTERNSETSIVLLRTSATGPLRCGFNAYLVSKKYVSIETDY
jgi:hypothetical protein